MTTLDTPCFIQPGGTTISGGYRRRRHDGQRWLDHRWAWTQAHGPIPDGLVVCHHCDNPPCSNVEHLFVGTMMDNARDRDAKGRAASGPARARRRLLLWLRQNHPTVLDEWLRHVA